MLLRKGVLASVVTMVAACLSAEPSSISGVESVIDADTIEIHGQRIRLFGVDAIESRQTCKRHDGSAWRCGKDSAFALADFIASSPIDCDVRDVDRYGRLVAVCRKNNHDINGWLVRNGWALAYTNYSLDYVDEQRLAEKEKLGIWQASFEMPWTWRRNH
ncbi:thermonuclease family protein [Tropicimonas sediminicola]|uniref:thermonuclease family protein n=1 Tax=Tropicimonas sediminicola TaxID=1031541 RepID=UPI000B77F353|nr:thermonuclease family protein [Tropicimonas sediminicola]